MTDTSVFYQINYTKLQHLVVPCLLVIVQVMILLTIFFEFIRDLRLDFNLLLALGIVGPNVNKSFKSKLAEELQKRGATLFLDIGTRSINIANNAFLEGIKCLKDKVNVDQFAIVIVKFLCQTICSEKRRL